MSKTQIKSRNNVTDKCMCDFIPLNYFPTLKTYMTRLKKEDYGVGCAFRFIISESYYYYYFITFISFSCCLVMLKC